MKKICIVLVSFMLTGLGMCHAANPILKGYADPHMKVWNDKMYIAVGKDEDPSNKNFIIVSWDIYSSSDLINWTLESHIDPKDTYLGENYKYCWAPDIVEHKGKYYFYFSNHGEATGVLVADKPNGPYVDVLKRPFIARDYSVNHEYDPTIFKDDDGKQYIIYGRNGQLGSNLLRYQIAPLSDDMLSFAKKPCDLPFLNPEEGLGKSKTAQDHQYFHKYNGTYYLSCAGAYVTSKNIYGPYSNLRHTGQNGHTSFCEYNGQWYHMYEWACEPYGNRMYRQVLMTYLHYKDNGDMVSDSQFLQATNAVKVEGPYYKTGVGNYDAAWDKIEAEWFFKRSGKLVKRESPNGGFEIQNIHDGDYLVFPNIKGLRSKTKVKFNISSAVPKGAKIEIREHSPSGKLLGVCNIANSGSWTNYKIVSCKLNNKAGLTNLCLVFKGAENELARLDWFSLQ